MLDSSAPGPIQPVDRTTRYLSMISVHSWNLFDDMRIGIADAAVQKNRRRQFQLVQNFEQAPIPDPVAVVAPGEIVRRLPAAQKLLFPERCGSYIERSRGECIKQEITARSRKRRDVLQRHSFRRSPRYNVSHFTQVVTKASYNIDALDDAWYHAPAAGGIRRLVCKRFANRTRRHLAAR
jgi:hypothetical protein